MKDIVSLTKENAHPVRLVFEVLTARRSSGWSLWLYSIGPTRLSMSDMEVIIEIASVQRDGPRQPFP
jgi:hypothetical protein